MISAKRRLEILHDIIAESGGIENIDLHGELSKRLSVINRNMQNMPVMPSAMPQQGTIPPQSIDNTNQGTQLPPIDQNQPPMQNEGQGSLMLP